MTELINDEAVYRTAPATPGLLKRNHKLKYGSMEHPIYKLGVVRYLKKIINVKLETLWLSNASGEN